MKRIAIGRPCCSYKRSCEATRVTVYDITRDVVVDEVYPARCWRSLIEGEDPYKEVLVGFDELAHLVFYRYRTNTNMGRIVLYNIPPTLAFDEVVKLIKRKWGYDGISMVRIARPATDDTYLYSAYYYKPLQ